ncbi:MAG: UbiD family decarboxylase [bacterium]|nr:UbiD family decarboxylase [bacterium]
MGVTGGPDLRHALARLESHAELSRVEGEVDWDRELGTVTREVLRRKGPALLFTNIRGYNRPDARCRQLATSLLASARRVSLLLGFDEAVPHQDLVEYVLRKNGERVAPELVERAPVHEHVRTGAEVDLGELPVPRWHHLDGGRYVNTFATVVTRDPDTRALNLGVYRGMVVGRDRIPMLIVPSQHGGQHFARNRELGRPMEVACVYGWDPVMDFVAGSPLPRDVCEYDVIGAYLGQPVPLVRCRTVDLEVPASAEIVVEGTISPDPATFVTEGPFGEFTGHVSDVPTPRPVLQVSALTHRSDPIFRGTLEGSLPGSSGENSSMSSIQRAAIAWGTLRAAGVPGVRGVFAVPVTNGTTVVVQIAKAYEGHAKQVASALWSTGAALYRYKTVIVVDEDIDPSDHEAVDWALAYRVRAGTDDLVVFPGSFGSPIDPSTPLEERSITELGAGVWNRLLLDATKTWRFPRRKEWGGDRFPPTVTPAEEDLERVRRRWAEYRFSGPLGG